MTVEAYEKQQTNITGPPPFVVAPLSATVSRIDA